MNKTVLGLAILVVLTAGGWYVYSLSGSAEKMMSADESSASMSDDYGSTKPDTTLVASENLMGKWRATDDPKFVREFKVGNQVVDSYDNEVKTSGLYVVFTKDNAPKIVPFPIDPNAVYVQITETGSQSDTLNFRMSMSPDANTLTLIYMDRGGATTYTRVQ